ncbi:MAG: hypothetical protein JXA10_15235, partial [Anaerolineae bacterium]|nr:hypothetical protein [Anaerolineae bacterium]
MSTIFLSVIMFLGFAVVMPVNMTSETVVEDVQPVAPVGIGQIGAGQPGQIGWREILTLDPGAGAIHAVDWSPDGARIVSGGDDGIVRIWNAQTGEELDQFAANPTGPVWSVAWSPDNRTVVSGGDDGTVRAW